MRGANADATTTPLAQDIALHSDVLVGKIMPKGAIPEDALQAAVMHGKEWRGGATATITTNKNLQTW